MPYDASIETVRIWMPNFLLWPPTSGISIFPELSVTFISKEELEEILAQPDLRTPEGRRDVVLLNVLCDTGARVHPTAHEPPRLAGPRSRRLAPRPVEIAPHRKLGHPQPSGLSHPPRQPYLSAPE